ncbi:uncharacterized protein LOC129741808 [Uranotaenia lowii]|uniref:uncharacterized protein LOC129741808 n=1 Tax=Uranotaenia lowii TaxID=190385 RepID=UPI0024785857|nr:uncharacterized protein LOC129741808 [Uranotaenia lowii]
MSATDSNQHNLQISSQHNCIGCTQPDEIQDMVACDECSQWWHYNCAGVSSNRSVVPNLARLRLQQLEEQKQLEDRLRKEKAEQAEKDRLLLAEQAEKDRFYLAEKHQLQLELLGEESQAGSERSFESREQLTEKWIQSQDIGNENLLASSTPVAAPVHTGAVPKILQLPAIEEEYCRPEDSRIVQGRRPEAATNKKGSIGYAKLPPAVLGTRESSFSRNCWPNSDVQRRSSHPFSMTVDQNPQPRFSYAELSEPVDVSGGSWCRENNPPPNSPPLLNNQLVQQQPVLLNAQQLAARHVVSRDLPRFSGDPLEWPVFLSTFESTTAMCGIQPDENLVRLQKCLVGSAREKVLNLLTIPSAVPEIIATLREECGRPDQLIHCMLSKIRRGSLPNANKLETLVSFGREVRNLVTYIEAARLQSHLTNPELLSELVFKLPPSLRLEWGKLLENVPEPSLRDFCNYVSSLRTAACKVTPPADLAMDGQIRRGTRKEKETGFLNTHQEVFSKTENTLPKQKGDPRPCLACDRKGHRVRDCERFKKSSLDDRLKVVQEKQLCRRCLAPHGKWPCRTRQPCGVDGCQEMHHMLLHCKPSPSTSYGASGIVTTHRHKQNSTLFKIIPVMLHGNGKSLLVHAFLDDGSDLTLIESKVADELGLDGVERPLCIEWTGSVSRNEDSSRVVQLTISKPKSEERHALTNVRTVPDLGLPKQSLNYDQLAKDFPHLRGLPICSYTDVTPKILIGVDHARLKLTLKRRERSAGEPVATKTRLGWVIFGGQSATNNLARTMVHTCKCSKDDELHDLVREYLAAESMGIAEHAPPETSEDQRARRVLQETTKRTPSGKYETGLLWKFDDVSFPLSYSMAERRLQCLERRLSRDPALKENVNQQIEEYQKLGYAHKATENELRERDPNKVWYLPIGVVQNPRKPGKVRVVWDAAASVNGTSLNSMLLKGPDLLTPLLNVLCRFRERQYAIAGDIRQMFHQILIRGEDKQFQRFLWRTDPKAPPDVYIMDVATFGATCSPCSAQYAKNLNASEHRDRYPEAAAAIVEGTYVDDFLDSRDSAREAVEIAQGVVTINGAAGFQIPTWQSNSIEVLREISNESENSTKRFSVDRMTATDRVLGMVWRPSPDVFVFENVFRDDLQTLLTGHIIPTKRQVLQVVMSLFDPLGIVAAFTIHGKILMQDIWRSGVNWDESIRLTDFENWKRWIGVLPDLAKVTIPRCYFPNYDPISYDSLQLHIFTDASETAYACVAFFRIVDRGSPRCCLVASKAKVTSLRPQSIPRNELNGAVIGARLMESIVDSHRLKICKRYFWTDSSVVISWLHADPRKYRQYVGFRVGEILSKTQVDEWRWIASKLNVADAATKWGSGPNLDPDNQWFKGPEFLYLPESEWPSRKLNLPEPTEEVKKVCVHREIDQPLIPYTTFSQFDKLVKHIAYLFHFYHRCRTKNRTESTILSVSLEQKDFESAEVSLWKMVQEQEFGDELMILRKNMYLPFEKRKRLLRSSPILKLNPILDPEGILRAESRIGSDALYYPYNFRNPIILPKSHHVTELLLMKYHQRFGHANSQTVLNEIQQKFYVQNLRTLVKSVVRKCMWCRVYRAKPAVPKMAPLPHPRIRPYVRPFTFTGVDYFGPLVVKRGRSNVKRWVCLFTCLTVRAIHLEVAHSLSTESCIRAIRRFVAKRGPPQHIFSDNGTNFRGAANELATQMKAINKEAARTFTNAETEWHFNPPSTPHMGGVWERKVRSVKDAFKVVAPRNRLDDEELLTFLAEVEIIVNSHPLTFVPLDSPNDPVLTPNCFLLMTSSGSCAPKVEIGSTSNLKANWRTMEEILNQFWKRWIEGYLPTIARRTKWYHDVRPLQEGYLVVIVDETVRNGWLRGRVSRSYPGSDGQVRRVDIETSSGVLQRGVAKVALLDLDVTGKTY